MNMICIADAAQKHISMIEAIERDSFSAPWTEEMLRSQLRSDSHVFLVALEGDDVVGYIGMMFVLDEGYISNVAVRPDRRGRGVGSGLVAAMVKRCREKRLAFVTLEVRESNSAARRIYSAQGFADVGVRKNYYERPTEDAVLMTLFLGEQDLEMN